MFEDLLQKLGGAIIEWPPPQTIPLELEDDFTLYGRVQVLRAETMPAAANWSPSLQLSRYLLSTLLFGMVLAGG